jgi:pimeloyl-ACP methyl ester carboxylesterase
MTLQLSCHGKHDTLVVMNHLFWQDTGSGRPLVLLHGGFLDHTAWDAQTAAFASRWRVIAPDARGHGRCANATGPYRLTDDLAALLRRLDTGPATLVGVSMGAATAVDTALEHPHLVSAVVVGGAGAGEPYFTDPWTTQALATWHAAMAAGDLPGSVEAFVRLGAGPHRALDDLDPDVVRRLRTMATGTMSKHAAGEPNWLIPVTDTWARAAAIDVPVLAINGALDSPDHIGMADRLVATVAHGRSVSIDGAAHYPNMERPEAFNEVLEDFLRTL